MAKCHCYYTIIKPWLFFLKGNESLSQAFYYVISHASFPCKYTINRTYVRQIGDTCSQRAAADIQSHALRGCLTRLVFSVVVNNIQRDGGACIDSRHRSRFSPFSRTPTLRLFIFLSGSFSKARKQSRSRPRKPSLSNVSVSSFTMLFSFLCQNKCLILTFSPSV